MSEVQNALLEFPMARVSPIDPPPQYAEFRHKCPVAPVKIWNGERVFLITKYDDARAVLGDIRFSSDVTKPGYPLLFEGRAARMQDYEEPPYFLHMDPPKHTAHRRMVAGEFMFAKIASWRDDLQAVIDDLINKMLAGPQPCDLVEALALPLPTMVICKLLGASYEDREIVHESARALTRMDISPEEALKSNNAFTKYLESLIDKKIADPGDDMLGQVVRKYYRAGEITRNEMVEMARLALVGGHETTANMTSLGVYTLLRHPSQYADLAADPSLAPNAVEELLRYLSIVHLSTCRVAMEDVQVGDQLIRAGEGVVVLLSSANRDEERFPDANRFDIQRGARNHVAFGFGPHQCVGQTLARLELSIVMATLPQRIPTLRLAVPEEELVFKPYINGLVKLPVVW
jgi:cytochrome P450